MTVDLKRYQDFVEAVTSKPSNDLTTFMNRLDDLDGNWIDAEQRHGPDINVPLLLTAALGLAAETGEFCEIPKKDDREALIVHRGVEAYVVMNLYPYNPGHLLICAFRHVPDLTDLSESERNEISALTAHAMKTLRKVSNPAGFNLGMNQGAISGAGVAAHIHQHVVPRWSGDANFMPIIGQTKVLPQLLTDTRDALAQAW